MSHINTFALRNMTIEQLFDNNTTQFSGYEDISYIPKTDSYIWMYITPYQNTDDTLCDKINSYLGMLNMVLANKVTQKKPFYAFTIANLNTFNPTNNNNLQYTINNYNNTLYSIANTNAYFKVLDIVEFLSNYPQTQWVDWKYYLMSQMAINPRLNGNFKKWYDKKVDQINLKRKKCLVLDLDNTLWGGILGEDGPNGVKIGEDYPGNAFLEFQKSILALAKSGVILTVCSKNNLTDVEAFWNESKKQLITKDQLTTYRINWQDKATNIQEIATELNIGLDSIVFIDDNPTERALVKGMLPQVETPEFPSKPHMIAQFIEEVNETFFRVYNVTKEDENKLQQYRDKANRENQKALFDNFDNYIGSLEIELEIEPISDATIERAAQMTQKTNQFNLTTKRYTVAQIQNLIDNKSYTYTLSVKDKFGDNGIVGLLIITPKGEIDTLLMSCRVLGKNIEQQFVEHAINSMFNKSVIDKITGTYIASTKNAQVQNFYTKIGFEDNGNGHFAIDRKQFKYKENNNYKIK